jgi:hypothetical protein
MTGEKRRLQSQIKQMNKASLLILFTLLFSFPVESFRTESMDLLSSELAIRDLNTDSDVFSADSKDKTGGTDTATRMSEWVAASMR